MGRFAEKAAIEGHDVTSYDFARQYLFKERLGSTAKILLEDYRN
jgi:hypothetical protein